MSTLTKLVTANQTYSLRTTVPHDIVKRMKLDKGCYFRWTVIDDEDPPIIQLELVR